MQANEADAKEVHQRHTRPSVIIGVSNHKTRKQEKKIDGEVAVVHGVLREIRKVSFHQMEAYHQQGGSSTKAIEYGEMWLCGSGHRCNIYFWQML